ncbi:MAG: hypothetical protein RI920_1882 [Pseudomonadota bacterium]
MRDAVRNRFSGLYAREETAGLAIHKLKLDDIVFWGTLFLAWLVFALPVFRYLSFMIPFLVLVTCLSNRAVDAPALTKATIWYVVFAVAMYPMDDKEGLKDLMFTFSGISIGLLSTMPRISLTAITAWTTAGFLVYFGLGGALFRHIEIDLAHSYSTFESNYAFLFALLMPVAVLRRQWLQFLFVTFMAVICLKRIALLGALLSCVFMLVPPRIGVRLINKWTMVAFNFFVLAMTMAYALGTFNYFIERNLKQSSNELGQGRMSLQREASRQILDQPHMFTFFGKGAGKAYLVAETSAQQYAKVNMHSDLLKLTYEFGFVFVAVYFYLLYSARNYYERVIYLYYNFLMFTDNALIYYGFLFFLVVVARALCTPPEPKAKVVVAPRRTGLMW